MNWFVRVSCCFVFVVVISHLSQTAASVLLRSSTRQRHRSPTHYSLIASVCWRVYCLHNRTTSPLLTKTPFKATEIPLLWASLSKLDRPLWSSQCWSDGWLIDEWNHEEMDPWPCWSWVNCSSWKTSFQVSSSEHLVPCESFYILVLY